mgnify:CR=1 FL=1
MPKRVGKSHASALQKMVLKPLRIPATAKVKPQTKKPKRRKKRIPRTESQIRDEIARNERLLEEWVKKLTRAANSVEKYTKQVKKYNTKLAVVSKKREDASKNGIRSIDSSSLD